ncbi:unnamed protein product, partial [Toxocara canis]|uniref:DNA helicase n=1 Tax=Toxocara canis TaxID=6265 RepID=A0A183U1Y3_TOXCA
IIKTNLLYPASTTDDYKRTQKSRKRKINEILNKRYDELTTFVDKLTAILIEHKRKRKALAHAMKIKQYEANNNSSILVDGSMKSNAHSNSSVPNRPIVIASMKNIAGPTSDFSSRFSSYSHNVVTSSQVPASHRKRIQANLDAPESGDEKKAFPKQSRSGSTNQNTKIIISLKRPNTIPSELSTIPRSSHSDNSASSRSFQRIEDLKSSSVFGKQLSARTLPTHRIAISYYKNGARNLVRQKAPDSAEDKIEENLTADLVDSSKNNWNDNDDRGFSDVILDISGKTIISDSKDHTLIPLRNVAHSLNAQAISSHIPSRTPSHVATVKNSFEKGDANINIGVAASEGIVTSSEDLKPETKPEGKDGSRRLTRIIINPLWSKKKTLHRSEGVVKVLPLHYQNARTSELDEDQLEENGTDDEYMGYEKVISRPAQVNSQHDQMALRGNVDLRLHSQPIFEDNDQSVGQEKDLLKSVLNKKKAPSTDVNSADTPSTTMIPEEAYVDDNGLWTMMPSYIAGKNSKEPSETLQAIARHSPIVVFNKNIKEQQPMYPEAGRMLHTKSRKYWYQRTPKKVDTDPSVSTIGPDSNGEFENVNMESVSFDDELRNAMQQMQRTTTQENILLEKNSSSSNVNSEFLNQKLPKTINIIHRSSGRHHAEFDVPRRNDASRNNHLQLLAPFASLVRNTPNSSTNRQENEQDNDKHEILMVVRRLKKNRQGGQTSSFSFNITKSDEKVSDEMNDDSIIKIGKEGVEKIFTTDDRTNAYATNDWPLANKRSHSSTIHWSEIRRSPPIRNSSRVRSRFDEIGIDSNPTLQHIATLRFTDKMLPKPANKTKNNDQSISHEKKTALEDISENSEDLFSTLQAERSEKDHQTSTLRAKGDETDLTERFDGGDYERHQVTKSYSLDGSSINDRQKVLQQIFSGIDEREQHGNKNLVWLLPWTKDTMKPKNISKSFSKEDSSANEEDEHNGER